MSNENFRELVNSNNYYESEHKLKQIITNCNCFLCFFMIGISFIVGGTILLDYGLKYKSISDDILVKEGGCIIIFGCISSGVSCFYLIIAIIKYVRYKKNIQNHIFRSNSTPFTIGSDNFNYPLPVFPRHNDSHFDPPPPYSLN